MRHLFYPLAATVLLAGASQAQAFQFFDSFEGAFPGNWVERQTSFGAAPPHITDPAAALGGALGVIGQGAWMENSAARAEEWTTFSLWTQAVSSQRTYLSFDSTAAGCKSFVFAPNTGDIRFQDNPGFGFVELSTTPFSGQTGTWSRMEVRLRPGGVAEGRLFDMGGAELASVTENFGSFGGGGVALRVGFANPGHYGDLVEATKIADAINSAPPRAFEAPTGTAPLPRTIDTNSGAATELLVYRRDARYELKARGQAGDAASIWVVEINGQPNLQMLGAGTLNGEGTMIVALPFNSLPSGTELRLRAYTGEPAQPTGDQILRTQ